MKKRDKAFSFIRTHGTMTEVLTNHRLASLGDIYINFAYSLALSNRRGKPSGARVKGSVLAEALKKARLREYMPARMTRHTLADAAEALIVYAWLHNYITLEQSVEILGENENPVEGFRQLLVTIKGRIRLV